MPDAITDFATFLARLGDALDDRAAEGRLLPVVFDPARRSESAPNEVLVGLGAWMDAQGPLGHQGACLNNKGAAARWGWKREPVTVAHLVRDAPDDLVAEWRTRFGTDALKALDRIQLIVEDASPDSVLSVAFWLARLEGVPAAELPQRWITSLTAWERDGVAPSVTRSWTALLSALSHSHFGARFNGDGIAEAWSDALRFTISLLRVGADPDGVDPEHSPAILADTAYGRAIAFAMNERQDYLQSLSRAVRLELLVPMAGAPGRQLLVDAYFAVETQAPSGVKKIFIRTDAENTALGNGFSVMGLYRPGLEGSGNDMTLSVDPRAGINLQALWRRLEALENERWQGERPNAAPRRIASYPDGGFDQPWWDDHGRYTLLGAPKSVAQGVLGSRLSWGDVLNAAWRSYNQLRDIDVLDLSASEGRPEPKPIERCAARRIASGQGDTEVVKHLIAVKWAREGSKAQSLQFTATVRRHLAAMITKAAEAPGELVGVGDLADLPDFDYLELDGGTAIVSREGAFLFDDWRDKDLSVPALTSDFALVVALLSACKGFDDEVDALYAGSSGKGGLFRSNTAEVLRRITLLRGRIAATFQKGDLSEASPERRAFRAALESRWGLDGKEAALTGRLKDLQEILEAKATLDTQGMAQLIGIVAIPNFVVALMALYVGTVTEVAGDGTYLYAIWMTGFVALISVLFLIVAFIATRSRD